MVRQSRWHVLCGRSAPLMFARHPKGFEARRRASKRRKLDTAERREMNKARARDSYCRFPLCGCAREIPLPNRTLVELKGEISHYTHRGMGGDPTGERTQAPKLMLLCNWRHKLGKYSVDKKLLRWEPLTEAGSNGPVKWLIDAEMARDLYGDMPPSSARYSLDGRWFELAVETALHEYEPLTEAQEALLLLLSMMDC